MCASEFRQKQPKLHSFRTLRPRLVYRFCQIRMRTIACRREEFGCCGRWKRREELVVGTCRQPCVISVKFTVSVVAHLSRSAVPSLITFRARNPSFPSEGNRFSLFAVYHCTAIERREIKPPLEAKVNRLCFTFDDSSFSFFFFFASGFCSTANANRYASHCGFEDPVVARPLSIHSTICLKRRFVM